MNGHLFDDLTRALAKSRDHKASRRTLLRAAGLGGAAGVVGSIIGQGNTTAALQDATPPPVPEAEPIDPPMNIVTVTQKAFELGLDIDALFRYVADEVRYEAYSGALRGETGTLWSMAGNSVDQSLLLAALLKEALVEVRFAIGTLDDATAQQLVDSMVVNAETALAQNQRAQVANLSFDGTSALTALESGETTPALTAEQQQALDQSAKSREALLAEADRQVTESVKLISDALASKNINLPDPAEPALPDRERQQHVWVQYADGTTWVDLDPSIHGAEAGRAYGTMTGTVDEIPAELDHIVRFRVEKEVVAGGVPSRQEVVRVERRARDLVGVPVAFTHVKPSVFKSVGLTISGEIEGTVSYIPLFFIGPDAHSADLLIQFGTGGGLLGEDAFGSGSSNEGDTLAEWLITEIVTPDGTLAPIERVVFDRVGIERRAEAAAAGTQIDVTAIPLVEEVDMGEAGSGYPPMSSIFNLAIVGGQVPLWFFDPSRVTSNALATFSFAEHGCHLLRDQISLDHGLSNGYRFYNDAPNVTAYVVEPSTITGSQPPEYSIEADLIFRSVTTLPVDGTNQELHAGILAGVLAHVAERISLETTSWASEVMPVQPPSASSVGRVFEEAGKQNIASVVLMPESSEADLAALAVSAQASVRIREALVSGFVVIVPGKSVQIDGTPVTGWWQIDLVTGETLDRMENGRGNVALKSGKLFGPLVDYALALEIWLETAPVYRVAACTAAAIFFAVGLICFGAAGAFGLGGYSGPANTATRGGAASGAAGAAASLLC